jgi:hypothetical protein
VLLPVDSLFSTEIVFLVTVSSSQLVSLHRTHQQVSLQTDFTVTNCLLISFCLAVIRFDLRAAVVRPEVTSVVL